MTNKMASNIYKNNPFFNEYKTPHHTIPFKKIKQEHYEEAFLEGIKREDEEIEHLINNPELPTFENTLLYSEEGKEHYYGLLDRVSEAFSNLMSAETNDEMQALAQKLQPILSKHENDISLNPKLFERIKAVYENHRPLTEEETMLLNNSYEGFVRSGALLNEEDKQKLRELSEKSGMLSLKFSENLLKERKAFSMLITDKKQLDGLPETAVDAAAVAAKEKGEKGWLFTLDAPSYGPFMTYSTQRNLRKKMYMAANTLCIHKNKLNNLEICKEIVNVKQQVAQLLGYETFADYVLKHRMASSIENVYKLLDELTEAYKPTAIKEVEEVEAMAKEMQGKRFELKPWDFSFYSHKLKMKQYNVDAEMLRPYLELKNVIKGVFGLATTLYGITFKENKEIQTYHKDVKAYEVFDKDGSYLAVLYADFFPRKGKQGGAWMTEFQGQWINKKGKNIRPHVSLVMNFTKPTKKKPALLTLGEVETFLHEFGHALHGIFANSRFESLSGTNVWWDFVELPSQFMENYAIEKEFLQTFAYHYKTGEVIPDELIERVKQSRNFMVAYSCLRQVSFGLLDMAFYTRKSNFKDSDSVQNIEKEAWKKAIVFAQPDNTCMSTQFSHIMAGGYSAGYYSYKWAELLDADAFDYFKQHGIFNKEIAQKFRDCILSKGGTAHPMTLYKNFRGKEPSIEALLKRDGIAK